MPLFLGLNNAMTIIRSTEMGVVLYVKKKQDGIVLELLLCVPLYVETDF